LQLKQIIRIFQIKDGGGLLWSKRSAEMPHWTNEDHSITNVMSFMSCIIMPKLSAIFFYPWRKGGGYFGLIFYGQNGHFGRQTKAPQF